MKNILWLFLFLSSGSALAAPACYEQATAPAHTLAFISSENLAEVTGLTPDGAGCVSISFWQGSPVFEQKIYAPFRQVYEAYATAIERSDRLAAQRLYAWLRPTPRTFPQWMELFSVEEGPPLPWGMTMALKIVRLLQPYPSFEENLFHRDDPSKSDLNMRRAWPMFFLLMGGEIQPSETWGTAEGNVVTLFFVESLLWRYPFYALEERMNSDRETQFRVR